MTTAESTISFDKLRRTMVVSIPVAFAQRGGRKQIIVPGGTDPWMASNSAPNNAIVAALAKSHYWRSLLESQEFASSADLARAAKVNESYLCRVLRLTLLAPEITIAILDGRQPSTLELNDLLKAFPLDWQAQRKLWGFAD
jgi:hypothetical protein